jgi:hypothetical protein
MTDSKFKSNIFLFLSVTVFMARLSICYTLYYPIILHNATHTVVLHSLANVLKSMSFLNYSHTLCSAYLLT